MSPTSQPLALVCCLILLAAGSWGCRPAVSPGNPNSTSPVALSNTTLPEEAEPSADVTAEASTDNQANSDDPQPEAAEPAKTPPRDPAAPKRERPTPKPQPGKTLDLTFDDIKFDIEPDAKFERKMLPQAIEDLGGQKIRIGGYMLPAFQQRDIKQFVLVRDNMECCFGPGAALYDCILVDMDGRGVDYTVLPVTVEGTFTVKEYVADGRHMAIYHLQGVGVR
ncbi:DUF3299 domain-containing protein [Bremerella cremea]|uniref:DUF3299 domain-containing protein n=1 Tax=Bremerella cremea TaxID=1031537 RepID=UPI0031E88417